MRNKFIFKRALKITARKTPKFLGETAILPEIHQCSSCQTVYDARFGASEVGITEGVAFADLPSNFVCATCDGEKLGFVLLEGIKRIELT